MAITTLNNRSINRSDTAAADQVWTATSATASDFQAAAAGGKVLQVVSTSKTDTFSSTSTSFTDITGLTVNITPAATSSKVLVLYNVSGGTDNHNLTRLLRDSTAISVGAAASSRSPSTTGNMYDGGSGSNIWTYAVNYLDSPSSTSQLTYKAQLYTSGGTAYINRTRTDADAAYAARTASTITVMEIGA